MNTASLSPAPDSDCSTTDGAPEKVNGGRRVRERRRDRSPIGEWEGLAVQSQRRNLYVDLSSALQVFAVRAAAHEIPEQCLFGSNTP